jgi:4-alpha-glucanotransferase
VEPVPELTPWAVDFERVVAYKRGLLERAWKRFQTGVVPKLNDHFQMFRQAASSWLEDYALFMSIREAHSLRAWPAWPAPLSRREEDALAGWKAAHQERVGFHEFCQFVFFTQWQELHRHANACGVRILGDLPIFASMDSADAWAHSDLFKMSAEGVPEVVAGVPPDYFSSTGQLWGNPVYRWERHAADGFQWWIERLRTTLTLVDALRLDHFRAFAAAWEVPAGDETAMNGTWVPGPGRALFESVQQALGDVPLIAEDLGMITPDVIQLRDELGMPGMAILQFAFSPRPRSTFLPYRLTNNTVLYTGTHDNNTTVGWYVEDATPEEAHFARQYMATDGEEIHWDMIRLAMASVADLAIVPHQDLAGLGADCRMNTPGQEDGNWQFRIVAWMMDSSIQNRLSEILAIYGRTFPATDEDEAEAASGVDEDQHDDR